ncbi:helix-turn-helix domain-containing protein [Streptococcus mitis]|uniref:Transcriptional regulator n=1 Tax=Streptococcus mitis TaxID=28037 RepID=A0A1X1L0F2_STRMT|nr:helix-turn-helix transcriptional regulator [Streptococcus mitis]ORP05054.1 transcriptional regulator [Streptococcus mitis]
MEFNHYGEIIHKIRQDRNMSLKEAAGDVITPNNLSRFEKGLSSIKVDTFFEILSRFNLDELDYAEVLHIKNETSKRVMQILNALYKNDRTKARQILGKKSEWGNIIEYYILKLSILNQENEMDKLTPVQVEAINYLLNYIFSIDTLYIRDFTIIEILLSFKIQCFELKFLEYIEKLILKGLEDSQNDEYFSRRYAMTGTFLIRTYSRYGYYDKAEKLIYRLNIIISQGFSYDFAIFPLFLLKMYEVYNLLRQDNPKAIEQANTVIHYMDSQNNLFPLAWLFETKNIFIQDVQRLNKTGIPFPTEDEE